MSKRKTIKMETDTKVATGSMYARSKPITGASASLGPFTAPYPVITSYPVTTSISTPSQPPTQQFDFQYLEKLERIAKALEQIVERFC